MNLSPLRSGLILIGSFSFVAVAFGGTETLRVATWNVSNYQGGREADIFNSVYGSFEGRSMRPDVILAQEIQSAASATAFLNVLNSAGGDGDWKASYRTLTGTSATNDQVVFYRAGKANVLSAPTLIKAAAGTSGNPRDVYRWDFGLANDAANETLSFYDVHLKAGDYSARDTAGGPTNAERRKAATDAIRADSDTLGAGHYAVVGGDFNVQRSSESDYQSLVGAGGSGRFFDPISTPGVWNNGSAFRFVHTQDPSGNGGMDDRHDQLLLSGGLVDGAGLDYVGKFGTAYSTTTWNDLNHSYRAWGNDGTSFNNTLTIAGNAMVGSSIAQSLVNAATVNGGHLPVFLDLKYQAVPEPATLAALGLGTLAVLRRRKR